MIEAEHATVTFDWSWTSNSDIWLKLNIQQWRLIEAEHPAVTLDNSTILSSGYRNRKFKRKPEALLNKHFTSVPLRCLSNRAMQLMQSRRIERHIQDQVKYLGCSFLWKQVTAFGQRNGVLDVWSIMNPFIRLILIMLHYQ